MTSRELRQAVLEAPQLYDALAQLRSWKDTVRDVAAAAVATDGQNPSELFRALSWMSGPSAVAAKYSWERKTSGRRTYLVEERCRLSHLLDWYDTLAAFTSALVLMIQTQ